MRCLVALVLVAVAQLAAAHPHNESAEVVRLNDEISQLRAELAALRLEKSQLQKEVASLKANSAHNEGPDKIEAEAEEENITFRSADEMLRRLPEKLNPTRHGWSLSQDEEVRKWLTDELTGRKFEAIRTVKTLNTYKAGDNWFISLYLEPQPMRFKSWGMEEKIQMIRLSGDAAFA